MVDYASTVWHDPLRDKTYLQHLNIVQRIPLIRTLSAFRTVTTVTLEMEAHVLPTHLRLRYQVQRTIARLYTLPRNHLIWTALLQAQKRRNNIGLYTRFLLAEALKTIDLNRLNKLETIDPQPLPLQHADAFAKIKIESDQEIAREQADTAQSTSNTIIYSDASGLKDHLGMAVVVLDANLEVVGSKQI